MQTPISFAALPGEHSFLHRLGKSGSNTLPIVLHAPGSVGTHVPGSPSVVACPMKPGGHVDPGGAQHVVPSGWSCQPGGQVMAPKPA